MMTADKRKAFKNIIERASKTFFQAFISSITIDSLVGVTDLSALKRIALATLIGALAAGISAVWNSFVEWLTVRIDEAEFEEELTEALTEAEGESEDGGEANG